MSSTTFRDVACIARLSSTMCVQALAQEVAHYLGMDLSGIKIKRFADGEIYVQVQVSGI